MFLYKYRCSSSDQNPDTERSFNNDMISAGLRCDFDHSIEAKFPVDFAFEEGMGLLITATGFVA